MHVAYMCATQHNLYPTLINLLIMSHGRIIRLHQRYSGILPIRVRTDYSVLLRVPICTFLMTGMASRQFFPSHVKRPFTAASGRENASPGRKFFSSFFFFSLLYSLNAKNNVDLGHAPRRYEPRCYNETL